MTQTSRPAGRSVSRAVGAKNEARQGYRPAKETKQGGKGVQKSESSTVPEKPGPAPRDPVEGRDGLVTAPLEGTMLETLSSSRILPGLQRIAEMAKDVFTVPRRSPWLEEPGA